jgi:hypothetical protein
LLIGKRLAVCLSRYAVGIDRHNRVLCNGDMLESHGYRLFPRQLKIKAVKCKRTDEQLPLLLERFQYLASVLQGTLWGDSLQHR